MSERIVTYVVKYPCKCPHRAKKLCDGNSILHVCELLSTIQCEHPFEFPAVCQLAMRGEKDGE